MVSRTSVLQRLNLIRSESKLYTDNREYTEDDLQQTGMFYYIYRPSWDLEVDSMAINQRQKTCLETELVQYFTDEKIESIVVPILSQRGICSDETVSKSRISLRLLDWLVTNYAKNKNIHYQVNGDMINVFSAYKRFLRCYKRSLFDPFRRKTVLLFTWKNQIFHTTVGQLNFLKFCDKYGVLTYAAKYHLEIDRNMTGALSRSKLIKKLTKAKRIKLSSASDLKVQITKVH